MIFLKNRLFFSLFLLFLYLHNEGLKYFFNVLLLFLAVMIYNMSKSEVALIFR